MQLVRTMPHTIKDGQSFAIRCRECGYEWRFDMPVTAERKRDSGTHPIRRLN